MKDWERYEQASREILENLREHLGLQDVQSKSMVNGKSGVEWEIDAIAKSARTGRLVIIECRLTKRRQGQSNIASLVLECEDVGAEKAIIVTPNPLQRGASILAKHHAVTHFKLDPRSSGSDFLAEAIGKLFLGIPSIEGSSNLGTPSIGPG